MSAGQVTLLQSTVDPSTVEPLTDANPDSVVVPDTGPTMPSVEPSIASVVDSEPEEVVDPVSGSTVDPSSDSSPVEVSPAEDVVVDDEAVESVDDSDAVDGRSVDPSSVVPLGLTVVEPEPSCSSEDGVTDDVDPETSVLVSVVTIAPVVDSELEEVVVSVDDPSLPEIPPVDSDDEAVVVGDTVDSVVIPDPGWMVEDESPPSEDILSDSSSGLLDWPLSKDPCNPVISLSHS